MTDQYPRFRLPVSASAYSYGTAQGRQVKTKLDGGFSRFQKGLVSGATDFSITVNCTTQEHQQYAWAFIEGLMEQKTDGSISGGIEAGTSPFILQISSRGILEDHLCKLDYSTVSDSNHRGNSCDISFVVEAEPIVDQTLNSMILDAAENGIEIGKIEETLDRLTIFVRDDMDRLNKR